MTSGRFAAAYALDWLAGDPQWMPHPVRLMGAAISTGERLLRRPGSPAGEFARGAVLSAGVITASYAAASRVSSAAGEILLAWTTLATRSLLDEAEEVLDALESGDIPESRRRLAKIVGRDTAPLDEPEICRAVIETVAEGLCDGVVAPLVYLALGGVPLAFAYKAVNTLDSMIGHMEPPYRYFGRAAARADDVANFLPARAAAVAIAAAARSRAAWTIFLRDGGRHPSPNAGKTEAAMAGALGVRLGGMNYYGGEPSPKPLLGAEGRSPDAADARASLRIAGVASVLVFAAAWMWLRWREK